MAAPKIRIYKRSTSKTDCSFLFSKSLPRHILLSPGVYQFNNLTHPVITSLLIGRTS